MPRPRAARDRRPDDGGCTVLTPLFDRFEGGRAGGRSLARDLEDLLGARRAASGPAEGLLAWGVPIPPGLSPLVESHRERVAALIGEALARFEPRLDDVRITPVEGVSEFLFELEGRTCADDGSVLRLRVLVPRRDGGLGAEVLELARVPRPSSGAEADALAAQVRGRTGPCAGAK